MVKVTFRVWCLYSYLVHGDQCCQLANTRPQNFTKKSKKGANLFQNLFFFIFSPQARFQNSDFFLLKFAQKISFSYIQFPL
jgi:hypothetical protein